MPFRIVRRESNARRRKNEGADGVGASSMAGIASHHLLSFEIAFVEIEHHRHHLAGRLFLWHIILVPLINNMAEPTSNSEIAFNHVHCRDYLISRQALKRLYIFELLLRSLYLRRERLLLSYGWQRARHAECYD